MKFQALLAALLISESAAKLMTEQQFESIYGSTTNVASATPDSITLESLSTLQVSSPASSLQLINLNLAHPIRVINLQDLMSVNTGTEVFSGGKVIQNGKDITSQAEKEGWYSSTPGPALDGHSTSTETTTVSSDGGKSWTTSSSSTRSSGDITTASNTEKHNDKGNGAL